MSSTPFRDKMKAHQLRAVGADHAWKTGDTMTDWTQDRHALARIIALTYKMQPHSMLNAQVPLLIADAILAWMAREGIRRWTPKQACGWKENDDGQYETMCGHSWEFISAGPAENKATFCPYCGKAIRVLAHQFNVRAARAVGEGKDG